MKSVVRVSIMVFTLILCSAPALAGSIEDAEAAFNQAQQLLDAGQPENALPLFVKAYSTYPQAKYVFGIATCYEKLGDLPKALEAYEVFTNYDPNPEVLKRVESEMARLKGLLAKDYGEVFVFTSPGEAQVIIGEISKQNIARTPTRRWLKAGRHSLLFKKDGWLPKELPVEVSEGEHVYIFVGLKPEKK